jgi:hypothetical protein
VDLKQNERWTDWMKKGKKICIAWGNGKWSYSVGLKLTASMSSSRQLQSRIQQHIQQMEHVKKLTRKKNLEIENIVKYDNPKLKKEYEENLCILRSQIKFLEISEMYTSKVCADCQHKTMKSELKQVERENDDGTFSSKLCATRMMKCNHDKHNPVDVDDRVVIKLDTSENVDTSVPHVVSFRRVNRDVNASINIAANIVYFVYGQLERTTWYIGPNES